MPEITISRRAMLMTAAASVALKAVPSAAKPMRLGGPICVKPAAPAAQAKAHRDLGYPAASAPSDLAAKDTDRISAIAKAFAAHDVVIAEVGAWKNMLDPDAEKRRANLTYVTDRLAVAEANGPRNVVDKTGR